MSSTPAIIISPAIAVVFGVIFFFVLGFLLLCVWCTCAYRVANVRRHALRVEAEKQLENGQDNGEPIVFEVYATVDKSSLERIWGNLKVRILGISPMPRTINRAHL